MYGLSAERSSVILYCLRYAVLYSIVLYVIVLSAERSIVVLVLIVLYGTQLPRGVLKGTLLLPYYWHTKGWTKVLYGRCVARATAIL